MIIFLVQQEDENKEDIKSWSSFDWNEIVRREIKKMVDMEKCVKIGEKWYRNYSLIVITDLMKFITEYAFLF